MDEVFRFLFLRPPVTADPVPVVPSSAFKKELEAALNEEDVRGALKKAAAALVASARGVHSVTALSYGTALMGLDSKLGDGRGITPAQLTAAIIHAFGRTPGELVAEDDFAGNRDMIADNLIAAKLLSRDAEVSAATLEHFLRLLRLIERAAANDATLKEPDAIGLALSRPTLLNLPASLGPRGADNGHGSDGPPGDGKDQEYRKRILSRIQLIEGLAQKLAAVAPGDLELPDQPDGKTPENGADQPTRILQRQLGQLVGAGELAQLAEFPAAAVAGDMQVLASSRATAMLAQASGPRLRLSGTAMQALGEQDWSALALVGVDLTHTGLPAALSRINDRLAALHGEVLALDHSPSVGVLGSEVVPLSGVISPASAASGTPLPTGHGDIKPVGVGDLLVVRQQLKSYVGGEVGYIENVLLSESRKRSTKRTSSTDTTVTTEAETTTEEERDTQTTERFELKTEASNVLKEDDAFKAGLSLSGSYGPSIEFKASTDFSMDKSKEESAKTATSYSKDVTTRAAAKVTARQLTRQVVQTIDTYEELNEHGFDNTHGTGNISGVYQWVDKVYENQVFNYGRRMMFDLMVPEPAVFWIYANTIAPGPGATLTEPIQFTLTPSQITEANYGFYVQRYQVAGVKPPPEPYVTTAKTFTGHVTHDALSGATSAEVPIPAGYQAVTAHATATGAHWDDHGNDWQFTVAVGRRFWSQGPGDFVDHYFTLDNEQGSVSLGISTFAMADWYVTVEIDAQRTLTSMTQWQLETHSAIMQAYLELERDYRDQLAALENAAAASVQGRNPDENRMIERIELKKASISVFTAQQYDLFGAVATSAQGYPQIDLINADPQGRYIRFFEQAFEWENLQYLFYPYFWGRKARWLTSALRQDADPEFAEFLKAGAARVVVPVRPGFEAAIAHFQDTGEIWEGADPPTLTSPLYVSIIDEIKERTLAPGTEVAQGDPWDVHLPTTLVKLRPDDELPAWTKQPDGEWVAS
jgi:hypothetical protein